MKATGDAHTHAETEMAVAIVMASHAEVTLSLSRSRPESDRDALALAVVAHKHAHLVDPSTEPDWLAWQDTMVVRRALRTLVLYLESRCGVSPETMGLEFRGREVSQEVSSKHASGVPLVCHQ